MTITPVQRETEKNDSIDDDRIQYGLRCSDVAYIIIDGGVGEGTRTSPPGIRTRVHGYLFIFLVIK